MLLAGPPALGLICCSRGALRGTGTTCWLSNTSRRPVPLKPMQLRANPRRVDLEGDTHDVTSRLAVVFHELRHPTRASRPYSSAIMDFTANAVLAYECGYNEADILQHLQAVLVHDGDLGSLGLQDADVDDLVCCISVVWVTLMSLRTTRWATGSAVSDDTLTQWNGFVKTIQDAYLNKRMTWYPLDRLRLELQLHSPAPPADTVEERARLVFATLEHVAPQFPA